MKNTNLKTTLSQITKRDKVQFNILPNKGIYNPFNRDPEKVQPLQIT